MYRIIFEGKIDRFALMYACNSVLNVSMIQMVRLSYINAGTWRRLTWLVSSLKSEKFITQKACAMSDSAPFLICPQCCSLDIEGPEFPADEDVLRCRACGHAMPYADMRAEVTAALDGAVRLIHLRVVRKLQNPPSQAATPAGV